MDGEKRDQALREAAERIKAGKVGSHKKTAAAPAAPVPALKEKKAAEPGSTLPTRKSTHMVVPLPSIDGDGMAVTVITAAMGILSPEGRRTLAHHALTVLGEELDGDVA